MYKLAHPVSSTNKLQGKRNVTGWRRFILSENVTNNYCLDPDSNTPTIKGHS
jgi:hypothetical protein